MKICSKCRCLKSLGSFHKCKKRKDGHRVDCKDCRKIESKVRRDKHGERLRLADKTYRENNKEKIKEMKREWYLLNREHVYNKTKAWRENNREIYNGYLKTYKASYRAKKINGCWTPPIWKFYKSCPEGFEVDHIIPLSRGGDHNISNLQYLPRWANRSKGNLMPWEWVSPYLLLEYKP